MLDSNEHQENAQYLYDCMDGDDPYISKEVAVQAMAAWWLICVASEFKMPIPAACTGPDGQMLYAWDAGRYHLELEIIPGEPAYFFYKERGTGKSHGEDYRVGHGIPIWVKSVLGVFYES